MRARHHRHRFLSPSYWKTLAAQELVLQAERLGSTAPEGPCPQVQLQLDRAKPASRSPWAWLHRERLQVERL